MKQQLHFQQQAPSPAVHDEAPSQGALFPSWIELGEDFLNAAITSTVPYDLRALRALKRSPLALDLDALVNYLAAP